MIFTAFGALDGEPQVIRQERAIRQLRQGIVVSRMTKMFFALLKSETDPLLLGDMFGQLFNMTLGLLGAFALGLLGLRGSRFDVIEKFVIGEIDD